MKYANANVVPVSGSECTYGENFISFIALDFGPSRRLSLHLSRIRDVDLSISQHVTRGWTGLLFGWLIGSICLRSTSMASGSPCDDTPVVESLENNGTQDATVGSQLPDDQLKAIKKVIDSLYAYREHE